MKIRTSSPNETFTIPTNSNETYNYDVRWSDPYQSGGITIITAFENGFTGDATHTYTEARDYIITIRGAFPRIFFANAGDTQKVVSIEQWGNNTWTSMREAFNGCTNLEINATDTPNLSNCTDMQDMFRECSSLKDNGGAVQNWNVSTITNFIRTFARAPIDETFGNWNVSNAIQMTDMFEGIQLSSDNYDDTLNRWALQSLNNNVVFSAGNSTYCNASLARNNILTNPSEFNWTIIDGGEACEDDKFITTWETTIANETITIPTTGSGYNYTVNWRDGSISVGNTSDATHTFETPGIHTIEIYGDFPRIYFDNSGDRSKILTIEQWGSQQWTTMNAAFEGCNNLKLNADDTPDLSIVTSMEKMFSRTSNLEDLKDKIGSWNTGNIINMSSLFRFSGFNENINAWNVANVQEMGLIFGGTSTFNQPLNNWDVRNVTSLNLAFSNARKFNQDISSWKLQSLANRVGIENLFINATDFNQNLGALDLSNILDNSQLSSFFVGTSMSQENYEATLIGWATLDIANGETRIPRDVSLNSSGLSYCNAAIARQNLINGESWSITGDVLNCTETDKFITTWQTTTANESITIRTSGGGSFYNVEWGDGTTSENQGGNSSHTYATAGTYTVKISGSFARLYTNNFTNIGNKMRSVEQWGTGQWSSFDRAFEGASNVVINATDIPDLSNVTTMFEAFKDCRKLVDNGGQMQNWDVSTIGNFISMFQGANLFDENLGNWDLSSATDLANMLNATNLSTANYDATLIGWAVNPNTPNDLNLGASGLTYCLGESARNTLDIDKNWGINDGGSACAATDFFITTWRTTTANQSITIPTTGSGYNYDIDWGDGTIEFGATGNATHTYTTAGVYKVKILGDFPRIYFNNSADKDKITSIDQWGTQQWTSMERAFYGCTALELNVSDAPDLSQTTSLERMFMGTNNIVDNEASMNLWNTSTITNMANMFADSIFDFNITSWDVGKVENFVGMFNNNAQFNQNIGGWNVGEFVTGTITMQAMFDSASSFNSPLNTWDTAKVTNMVSMFGFATAFNQPLDTWDTSTIENMGGMFFGASDFDQNVGDWNLSSVTNMGAMFQQSGLSTENYDTTLIGWAKQDAGETIPSNISISFEGSQYCFGADARNTLTDTNGLNWSISDDGLACASTDFFITTWQTTATNESITIPTTGSGYDYTIDWGDGTIEFGNTGNASHSYTTAGIYTIKILGDFPQFASLAGGIANAEKLRTIEQWGNIEWQSMLQAFSRCSNMNITAADAPDLSQVTQMSQMFFGCNNLQSPDLSGWDTSNITSMDWMFLNARNFNGDISTWDVGNVTDFTLMLAGVSSFNQDISTWNIGENVIGTVNMNSMLTRTENFDQNLGNWDLQKVTDIDDILANSGLSVANYDATLMGWASNANTPDNLVLGADGLTYCFGEAARNILTSAPYNWTIDDAGLDCSDAFITTWQTTTTNESITVPTTESGYNYVIDWGDGTIESGFTGNATHEYATSGTYTVKITGDFPRIYFNNTGDKDKIVSVEQWGTQQWTSMESAFTGCSNLVLNALDVPDLSNVTNMNSAFTFTTGFIDNGGEFGNWNVSEVTSMQGIFAFSGMNENINNWNVSNVRDLSSAFFKTPNFNQPLNNWVLTNANNIRGIFKEAVKFNQPLNDWNISGVNDLSQVFNGAEKFNQPLDKWDVSNVSDFSVVFSQATSFNQSLGDWDISNATNMTLMLRNSGLSKENYDQTLIGWAHLEAEETKIPTDLFLNADNLIYCLGIDARNTLTSALFNWTILDAGTVCTLSDAFITTWQTTAANESITIPTNGSGYTYDIDWGDGTIEYGFTGNATHEYATANTYTVRISGDFPRIYINGNSAARDKIIAVDQWGTQQWTSMENAFRRCSQLVINATDAPDLSLAKSMDAMFDSTSSLVDHGGNMGNWDVSTIEDMSNVFNQSNFDENISTWNVSAVKDFSSIFFRNTSFNQNLDTWDTSACENFGSMFDGATAFNGTIGSWNTEQARSLSNMFRGATTFNQDISAWDTKNVVVINNAFDGATAFNQDLGSWDISSLVENTNSIQHMFSNSGMSTTNYDNTLIGWARLDAGETKIPVGVIFDAENINYCLGEAARNVLTSAPYNWIITDGGFGCDFTNAFITTWQTTTTNESITIPTTGGGYNYIVDWGDGIVETDFTANASHTYTTAGTYTVKIIENFPRIYFNNSGDKDKIIAITQWGTNEWTSMESAFYGCSNVIVDADDTPDLTNVTSLRAMFKGATNLIDTEGTIANWDTRTIVDLGQLFMDAEKFNTPLNSWSFFVAEDLSEMFRGAKTFNQPVNWYTPSVNNLKDMFNGATSFDQNMGSFNISLVTDMSGMFSNAGLSTQNYDQTLAGWFLERSANDIRPNDITFDAGNSQYCLAGDIIDKLTNDHGWQITDSGPGCDESDVFEMTWDLTSENRFTMPTSGNGYDYTLSLSNGEIFHVTSDIVQVSYSENIGMLTVRIYGDFPRFDFDAPFVDKEKLATIEQWGNLQLTEANGAFEGCTNLKLNATDTPDLSQVISTVNMFKDCTNLEDLQDKIGDWNMGTITNISTMFEGCSTFNEDIGQWDTSNVFFMDATFSSATSFNQDISGWDTSNVAFFRNTFNGATAFDQSLGDWNISGVQFFMTDMFTNSGMSQASYDDTLIGWATLSTGETKIPNNVRFDINAPYCLGKDARDILTNAPNNWRINDEGFRECDFTNAFIYTWQTEADNEMINIPTASSDVYNYTVDWGDGTVEGGLTGEVFHTFTTAGVYTIKITGQFPRLFFLGSDIRENLLTVEQWGTQQWTSMNSAFSGCINVKLNATDTPDLSQVTSMDRMFRGTTSLVDNQDMIGTWNVSNVISMVSLFEGSTFNENINNWNVSGVQTMGNMFQDNTAFNQPLDQWNPQNVSDFEHMFNGASAFNQPIGSWNIISASAFESMFQGATAFDQDLSDWDISLTDRLGMVNMFIGSGMSTENYDATLIGWATLEAAETQIPINVTLDADTFYCLSEIARNTLTSVPYSWTINDLGNSCPEDFFITTWQTTTTNESITIPTNGSGYNYIVDWGDGTVETGITGSATHQYATANTYTVKFSGDFPRIWFGRLSNEDKGKLLTVEQWGPQQWTSMQSAFSGCYNLKLNADDMPDLSQVTRMSSMFRDCTNLEDLKDTMNTWDMTTIESIALMFKGCILFDENIGGWTFTSLTDAFNAFEAAATFNQDISNWDVSKVDEFDAMFKDATSFNQPIGKWTLGTVDYIDRMFQGATAFNQDLNNWDFSNVYEAGNMFEGASSFNQDLSSWDISNVETLDNFFTGTAMSTENYDKTLIGWATLEAGEIAIPADMTLNADASYCLAETERNMLTSAPYNWTITDGGLDCPIPVITLLGDNPQIIEQGDPYTELGATVTYGATLTIDVSLVNTNQLGNYTVTYNASTPSGANADEVIRTVNVVEACPILSLPATNFSITASSETCIDTNNGMISISAATSLDYITTINGVDYNFTSILEVDNLAPGTYSVCIKVDGFTDCEQCFEAAIEDAATLVGKTEVITETGSTKVNVELTAGTAPYIARINDEIIGEFAAKTFSVEVQHGDEVEISSSVDCEGKLSEKVNLYDNIIVYPNPTSADVTVIIPNPGTTVSVTIHNVLGTRVSSKTYNLIGGSTVVPMENLQAGVYFLSIGTVAPRILKIVKQ